MPIYHYSCPQDGVELEAVNAIKDRNKQMCPECGTKMTRPIKPNKPFFRVFKELTLTNLELNPVTFTSEKALKDYCKKNRVASSALL